MKNEVLTIRKCAEECGVHVKTFTGWVRRKKITAIHYSSRCIRITRADLEIFKKLHAIQSRLVR